MLVIKKVKRFAWKILQTRMPVFASKVLYFRTFRKRLNLKNPKTFNEKLMWLKLYEDYRLKTKYADKYLVRDYISRLGYSNILIDLYKVYESVEEINFKELPKRFVMKCTHGSGFNIICQNKDELDLEKTKVQLKKWMETDYGLLFCEPHYSQIKPRIIVEKFLDDEFNSELPIDYMIHCFHGVPQVIEVGVYLGNNEKTYSTFNCSWDILPYFKDSLTDSEVIRRPTNLEEILEISKELSKDFTYVRVDLYYCHNKIYFGELTFTPAGCVDKDFFDYADYKMGELLDLTALKTETSSKKVSIARDLKVK